MNVRHLFSQTPVAEITPEDAQAKQKAGTVIVDVREPYEWSEGSIPGAIHIPLGTLSRRLAELDASRAMIMVCRSGSRSRTAVQILQRAGFSQVENLTGGMINWMRQRLPVSKK